MFSKRQIKQWLTSVAVILALACLVGYNIRAVYACDQGCHLGNQLKNRSNAYQFGATTARPDWWTSGITGGTWTTTGTTTTTLYNYYTPECEGKTKSWCSALDGATTTTSTDAQLAYCAGS